MITQIFMPTDAKMPQTLPWSQIDTVLLDMDGTLLDLHFDNFFWLDYLHQCHARTHGCSVEASRQQLIPLLAQYAGTLEWYCVEFWTEQLQLPIRQMKREQAHRIAPRPQALEFLQALRKAGKHSALITNAHRHSLDIKLDRVPMAALLDAVISSHDYGYPKESPLFWQALQQQFAFDPQRTLFIDDSLAVLRSAAAYGISHVRCVAQPDSQGPARDCGEFMDMGDFADLCRQLA